MTKIDSSFFDIAYLDALSFQRTSIHLLDPRAKILTTLVFVVTVVSFDKYEVSGLLPFIVYPVALIALGNLPPGYLMKKVLLAAPFAFFIGIFNPLLDRGIVLHLGAFPISGGWLSFMSIMMRFVLTVGAALVLIASTGFYAVCMALEKMGVPRTFAVQLLFLYRYIFVLIDEAARMARARSLRAFTRKGTGLKVFGYLIGQLLLRTLDRAQRIHLAMLCRAFDGEIRPLRSMKLCSRDIAFFAGWSTLFILMRLYNVPLLLGNAVTELMR